MMNTAGKRALIWTAWAICFALGSGFLGIFAWGVLRDTHFEEARVRVDLGRASAAGEASFRLWGSGVYDVHLATVHSRSRPDDPVLDRGSAPRFQGALEVRVTDPRGGIRFHDVLEGDTLDHALPGNIEWSRIQALELEGSPLGSWRLEARVVSGDSTFASERGYRSDVLVRKRRVDPGMGGLINYVMLIPGIVFAGLALGVGVQLARMGASRVPAGLSVALLVALALFWRR